MLYTDDIFIESTTVYEVNNQPKDAILIILLSFSFQPDNKVRIHMQTSYLLDVLKKVNLRQLQSRKQPSVQRGEKLQRPNLRLIIVPLRELHQSGPLPLRGSMIKGGEFYVAGSRDRQSIPRGSSSRRHATPPSTLIQYPPLKKKCRP